MVNQHKWIGAFGEYDIPNAIVWLAEMAQAKANLPPMDIAVSQFRKFWEDPGFLVCKEWGDWRDDQARIDYELADKLNGDKL